MVATQLRLRLWVGLLALSVTVPCRAASSSELKLLHPIGIGTTLALTTQPPITSAWRLKEDHQATRTYEADGYNLTITRQSSEGNLIYGLQMQREDGAPFRLQSYQASHALHMTGSEVVFTPNFNPGESQGLIRCRPPTSFEDEVGANKGIPYAQIAGERGYNGLAVGWLNQGLDTHMSGASADSKEVYHLILKRTTARTVKRWEDALFVSTKFSLWFAIAQEYARFVDGRRQERLMPVPPFAYEPAYDTWYFTADRINQRLTLDYARRCRELGLVNYHLDAGWDVPTGEYAANMTGRTGDYRPPTEQFPNFDKMLLDMRGLRLNTILWLQPFQLGRRAAAYPEMKDALVWIQGNAGKHETPYLCPRVPKTRLYLRRLFQRVLVDYGPFAGVWLDAIDGIPSACVASHEHDEPFDQALRNCLKTIRDTVRGRVPKPLIYFRFPYANLHNKPYANMWQPIDHPGDYEGMRLQAIAQRAFGFGVCFATDEQYWPAEWADDEVARCLATVVFTGVPALSFDFNRVPASHVKIVKAWLEFYRQHRAALVHGAFSPFYLMARPNHKIETKTLAFVFMGRGAGRTIPLHTPREAYIVNGSDNVQADWVITGLAPGRHRLTVYDRYLRPHSHRVLASQGTLAIAPVGVEKAGLLKVERLTGKS